MKPRVLFALLATALLMSSCETDSIRASNEISNREYNFTEYSGLEISGDFNAFVRFSETEERIEIEANENLHNKILVTKDGNTLKIRLQNNTNIRGNATLNAYITTRNISNYWVSGDSDIELETVLVTDNASIDVRGDSGFTGEIDVNTIFIDLKGDSEADIFGTATQLDGDLSGDSKLKDYDLSVNDLNLKLSGDSTAFLSVTNTIDIDASGDSELNYRGDAEIIRQRLTGDSKINKRD